MRHAESSRHPVLGTSPIPRYVRLADIFRQRIARGAWPKGRMLPSIEALMKEFSVARVTVRQAVKLLREEGLVSPQRGRGTLVNDVPPRRRPLRVHTTFAGLVDMYRDDRPVLTNLAESDASPALQDGDGTAAPSYFHMRRVHARDGIRYCLISMYIDERVFDRDPQRFRGADYDSAPTTEHHVGGRHEYLLSETVLSSDLVVNLPKLKTHKKTGVTLALKNMVGINGDKNLLPHHCVGSVDQGGDEFPGRALADRLRSRATELARGLLKRGIATRAVRALRRAEDAARGGDFVRSGNWHGNRTTWRMCVDLNRCLYYSDAKGEHFSAPAPVRRVLTVLDAVVAGEGEGPLAPGDRPLGAVLASTDPVALDLVAIALMGFDARRIPKVWSCMGDEELALTQVGDPGAVRVCEVAADGTLARTGLDALRPDAPFRAHPGWRGHIEADAPPPVGGAERQHEGGAPCAG